MSNLIRKIQTQNNTLTEVFSKADLSLHVLILFFAILRLLLSIKYGLGSDEAHYATYGNKLALSYFDHPPLVGWVEFIFQSIFGHNEFAVRLAANLLGILTSYQAYNLLKEFGVEERKRFWIVIALNTSILVSGLFLMFLPDTLLVPLSLWFVGLNYKIIKENKFSDWLWLGLCFGLMGLAKYTGILFAVSFLVNIVSFGKLKFLLQKNIYVMAIVSFVMILPILIWNYQHQWISLKYQFNHVVDTQALDRIDLFVKSWLVQYVAYGVFLIPVLIFCIFKNRQNLSPIEKITLNTIWPGLLFFMYSSTKGFILPHWTLYIQVLFIILGSALALKNSQQFSWLKRALYFSFGFFILIMSVLFLNWYSFKDYQTPYADLLGWPQIHQELKKLSLEQNPSLRAAIAVPNWVLGSRAYFYLEDIAPIFVLDQRYDQFDLWESQVKEKFQNYYFLSFKGFEFDENVYSRCKRIKPLIKQTLFIGAIKVTDYQVELCEEYRGLNSPN